MERTRIRSCAIRSGREPWRELGTKTFEVLTIAEQDPRIADMICPAFVRVRRQDPRRARARSTISGAIGDTPNARAAT